MYVKEFKALINRGLGSAIRFLQENPKSIKRYYNAILYACTHDTTYDPQCEPGRAQYLYEIIALTPFQDELEHNILESFSKASDFWDLQQFYDLAQIMAQNGNGSAQDAMYQNFKTFNPVDNSFVGAQQIISLDKEEGLIFVTTVIGEKLLSDDDYVEDDSILQFAREEIGDEEVAEIMLQESNRNPNIKAYLDSVNQLVEKRGFHRPRDITYAEVKQKIDEYDSRNIPYYFHSFGIRMSPDDLILVAQDFEKEKNKTKLIAFLHLFTRRKYPLNPQKIINLVKDDGGTVSNAAFKALAKIKHDALHDLVVKQLNKSKPDLDSLDLLILNYQKDDYSLLEKVIKGQYDDFDFHGIGMTIIDIYQQNETDKCLHVLIEIYKKGLCSHCRERCVDILIANGILPKWMKDECRYDSNLNIRKKVNEYILA